MYIYIYRNKTKIPQQQGILKSARCLRAHKQVNVSP